MVGVRPHGGRTRMLDHAVRNYPLDDELSAVVGGRPLASARKDNVPAGGDEEAVRDARDPGEPAAGHDNAALGEPQQNEDPSGMDTDRTRHRTRHAQLLVHVEVTVIAEPHRQTITFALTGRLRLGDRYLTIRQPGLNTITRGG
jgi:hypothetical protein